MTAIAPEAPPPATSPSQAVASRHADLRPLPRRPVRRPFGLSAFVLSILFVAAAAFYGGVLVEKHHVPVASSSSAASAARAQATNGTTAAGGGTQGTISAIDGTTITITEASGATVKVTTSAASRITKTTTSTAAVQDLRVGDTASVIGPAGAGGAIQATSIRDTGAGGLPSSGVGAGPARTGVATSIGRAGTVPSSSTPSGG